MELEKALQTTMTAVPISSGYTYQIFADYMILAIDPENYTVAGGWCSIYEDIAVD